MVRESSALKQRLDIDVLIENQRKMSFTLVTQSYGHQNIPRETHKVPEKRTSNEQLVFILKRIDFSVFYN